MRKQTKSAFLKIPLSVREWWRGRGLWNWSNLDLSLSQLYDLERVPLCVWAPFPLCSRGTIKPLFRVFMRFEARVTTTAYLVHTDRAPSPVLICRGSFIKTAPWGHLRAQTHECLPWPHSRAGAELECKLFVHSALMLLSTTEHRVKEKGTIEHRGLSHDRYYDAEPRPGARAQCRHVTEISCINGALLGSLGSSLDSAAHLANFFMSISPDVPIAEMASALFKALKRKGSLHETGFFFFLPRSSLGQDHATPACVV